MWVVLGDFNAFSITERKSQIKSLPDGFFDVWDHLNPGVPGATCFGDRYIMAKNSRKITC